MTWRKGIVTYKKILSASEMIAYLDLLNKKSAKVYDKFRGTQAETAEIIDTVEKRGEFRLCILLKIPYKEKIAGNSNRLASVRSLFNSVNNTLSKIPPIVVSEIGDNKYLHLIDGATRCSVALERKMPLLAYVPESVIKDADYIQEFGIIADIKRLIGI
jgi:hypothetical protein